MNTEWTLLFLLLIAGFAFLAWLLISQNKSKHSQDSLEDAVNKIFGMTANKIAEQSREILTGERETIKVDLANKQKMLEELITGLKEDISKRQEEIRTIERDRISKFKEISVAIDTHRKLTEELKMSTQQLATVLSNNQQRGGWGERIIEDLLKSNGLIEGIHYHRQAKLGASTLKPDITLLLPNERCVPVDVKFPYQEIQKMTVAETKAAKETHLKQFGIDLKTKVVKVAEYITPENNTLDYAILFVPNEMVFSFINQKFPDIVDDALSRRVIIVSPFTFLIVARTVMESYRNFMIGDKLKEVVKYVDEFSDEWIKFMDEFEKFGRSLETLRTGYDKLITTRKKQMDRKIEKIETYRRGATLENDPDSILKIEG